MDRRQQAVAGPGRDGARRPVDVEVLIHQPAPQFEVCASRDGLGPHDQCPCHPVGVVERGGPAVRLGTERRRPRRVVTLPAQVHRHQRRDVGDGLVVVDRGLEDFLGVGPGLGRDVRGPGKAPVLHCFGVSCDVTRGARLEGGSFAVVARFDQVARVVRKVRSAVEEQGAVGVWLWVDRKRIDPTGQ